MKDIINKIKCNLKKINECFSSTFFWIASYIVRRDEKCIAFGSWCGKLYSDNSRFLLEKAMDMYDDSYNFYWIGDKNLVSVLPKDKRIRLLQINCLKSNLILLKCKYMFCSQFHYEDLSSLNVFHGAIITYLHHGCPIKKLGDDALKKEHSRTGIYQRIIGRKRRLDYFIASSDLHYETNLTAFKSWGCNKSNNLRTGTPRNDYLISASESVIKEIKRKYSNIIGFNENKKVVLYAPTFRRTGMKNESLINRSNSDKQLITDLLKENGAVLIEKAHFVGDFDGDVMNSEVLFRCPKQVDFQELLLLTDVLISDYSGAFLDFSLLDRPIIHYIYDYEFYRDVDSGMYYELDEFIAGDAPISFDELISCLTENLNDPSHNHFLRDEVRKRFMQYEKGEASYNILKRVVGAQLQDRREMN